MAYREFWELAGGCVCWLFCAPVYGDRREVVEKAESEVQG